MPGVHTLSRLQTAVRTLTIASGQTTSDAVDIQYFALAGLIFPAAFTGATITFQVSDALDGTFVELVDQAGAAISVTATDGKAVGLDDAARELAPWRYFKIVSAGAEAADREIKLILKAQ